MQVNDYVNYGMEGICKITEITCPDFASNKSRQYFVLVPLEKPSSRSYVPVDIAESKCRKLISAESARELIEHIDEIQSAEITNEKEREQIYRSALKYGDLLKIVSILKNIHRRRELRLQRGKKMTAVDDKYYRLADQSLCHELGFVLKLSEDEVRELLHKKA